MAEYKKQYRTGGTSQRPFSKGGFASKELFDAECNSCHNRCQVPFRPNGKKPVYCANCFVKEGGNDSRDSSYSRDSSFSRDRDSRPSSRPQQRSFNAEVPDRQIQDLKRQIEAMNATLKDLVTAVDTFNRATALTLEIQKHFPATKDTVKKEAAPKKAATKTVKAAKAAPKKTSKK